MKKLSDFRYGIDLEAIADALSVMEWPGENNNQDPCFTSEESGFELSFYGEDNQQWGGFTLILTSENRYKLKCVVSFFDHDFNVIDDVEKVFDIDSSYVEYIYEWSHKYVMTKFLKGNSDQK
jgi:hypothetical protein